jgi:hypothetical protein
MFSYIFIYLFIYLLIIYFYNDFFHVYRALAAESVIPSLRIASDGNQYLVGVSE